MADTVNTIDANVDYDLIEDLVTLTTIHESNLRDLSKLACYVICNDIEEAKLDNTDLITVDIGLGKLQISIEDNKLAYRFMPSSLLRKSITSTIIDKKNPLTELAETSLTNKFLNTYKDYL